MRTSKQERSFWTWLSRTADVLQVFGAAMMAIAAAAWLFIRSVPAPVIVLASVGVFAVALLLLVRLFPSAAPSLPASAVSAASPAATPFQVPGTTSVSHGWLASHRVFD